MTDVDYEGKIWYDTKQDKTKEYKAGDSLTFSIFYVRLEEDSVRKEERNSAWDWLGSRQAAQHIA